ncbi:SDR family oxidoreductase [Cellulomonas sp. APG4]|uniref:SDR family oxidoreductase n=1 Tax=Cellulomonas sp. APG4 TaxID=1538656 RepID=UPI001379A4F8|nr:SDR family oxidoreductase [Cellulomonas sp. APG4]NCT89433.1 SDR family oxidoreductase [Cellulomonas sp. APG4]
MTTFAVTGASGKLGRRVVTELLDRGVPAHDVVAVVRDPARATDLAERGVEVRVGDYARPETLTPALSGVDRLLLVSGSEPGNRVALHGAVIDAAVAAGVSRIAYTSILDAGASSNPLAGEHRGTEELLRASGLPTTLLRNGWYAENYTDQIAASLDRGVLLSAAGDGRISAAPRADYAVAAAAALLDDAPGDRVHELGGPSFDLDELAATVTEVTGRPLVHRSLPAAEYVAALVEAGLDQGTATFLAALDTSVAAGDLETDSRDLEQLLGRPVTPLADVVREALA